MVVRPCGFELPPFSWRLSRSVVGIVAGAWGIDHVSVGCVPHRATGVRPERPAGAGGPSISPEFEFGGCVSHASAAGEYVDDLVALLVAE